jgi:hypothetical protein
VPKLVVHESLNVVTATSSHASSGGPQVHEEQARVSLALAK